MLVVVSVLGVIAPQVFQKMVHCAERPFHHMKLALKFWAGVISFFENLSHIMKYGWQAVEYTNKN